MKREGLFEGKSLWGVINQYWPENPLTILNKLKKRYDCYKAEGIKKSILNNPALIK